jgi:lipoyl(octanoyl) transferase
MDSRFRGNDNTFFKMKPTLIIKHLSLQPYEQVWQAMQNFTDHRSADTPDELWNVEHPPVFTLGLAGKTEHILNPHHIPIVKTDRGGQVTYHGPGQIVIYLLIDLKRREQGIRNLVCDIEKSIIKFLAEYNIEAQRKNDAPGVYVQDKKIASIGLRVRRGCTYHGLSFNFDMDLTPFSYINPCGYPDLKMTQFSELVSRYQRKDIESGLVHSLERQLGYN